MLKTTNPLTLNGLLVALVEAGSTAFDVSRAIPDYIIGNDQNGMSDGDSRTFLATTSRQAAELGTEVGIEFRNRFYTILL